MTEFRVWTPERPNTTTTRIFRGTEDLICYLFDKDLHGWKVSEYRFELEIDEFPDVYITLVEVK